MARKKPEVEQIGIADNIQPLTGTGAGFLGKLYAAQRQAESPRRGVGSSYRTEQLEAAAEAAEAIGLPSDLHINLIRNQPLEAAGGRGLRAARHGYGRTGGFQALTESIAAGKIADVEAGTGRRAFGGGGGDATGHGGPGTATGPYGGEALTGSVLGTGKTLGIGLGPAIGKAALSGISKSALASAAAKVAAILGIPMMGISAVNSLAGAAISADQLSSAVDATAAEYGLTESEKANLSQALASTVKSRSLLGHAFGTITGNPLSAAFSAAATEGTSAPAGIGVMGGEAPAFGPVNARTGLQSFSVADMMAQDAARPDIAAEIPLGPTESGFHGILGAAERGHLGIGQIGDIHGYGDVASHGLQGHRGNFGNIGRGDRGFGGGGGGPGGGSGGSSGGDAGTHGGPAGGDSPGGVGFRYGGYTGTDHDSDRDEPRGVVHEEEYVLPREAVEMIGVPSLERLRRMALRNKKRGIL